MSTDWKPHESGSWNSSQFVFTEDRRSSRMLQRDFQDDVLAALQGCGVERLIARARAEWHWASSESTDQGHD
jgi:hypothetical protein